MSGHLVLPQCPGVTHVISFSRAHKSLARPCCQGAAASDEPSGGCIRNKHHEELSELPHCLSQKSVVSSFLETVPGEETSGNAVCGQACGEHLWEVPKKDNYCLLSRARITVQPEPSLHTGITVLLLGKSAFSKLMLLRAPSNSKTKQSMLTKSLTF